MKWFRRHIKTGSRLALFALAVQFVLSFGHFHPIAAAQAAPALQTGLSQLDFAFLGTSATPDLAIQVVQKQPPAHPDNDPQPADTCAICAIISLAGNLLAATPPVLLLPEAVEFLHRTTDAEFLHLKSAPAAFRSRAPPLS
ncbi:DUF2946 family protein [Bradyrhizobium sp. CCBAU 51753]|uniref:DUF2946 family protein n=1 Tax=Bradyrhizobium sp. CCBAU 51753 TaxID=1325100 RepID=UPI00188A213A|nr:DUF2946 family protein [Bradyrhizobium sp. CCBAU 51753]QOZ28228.1 hypothetical protein XH93_34940 [Bradyrhizobium sp. CCBAU 51753]